MSTPTDIEESYRQIRAELPPNVDLVAVSKTHPPETIRCVYDLGHRKFGENKVQELMEKQPDLPPDIQWHLIGHLQRNKVKYIADFIDTIQSVDSEKILREIDKQARKNNRKINVLLQIKIAEEDTKFGLDFTAAEEILKQHKSGNFPNVQITGLMGMATFTADSAQLKKEFSTLKKAFDAFSEIQPLQTLSMGMSDDFRIAIGCGSNSVRIGSAIFGRR